MTTTATTTDTITYTYCADWEVNPKLDSTCTWAGEINWEDVLGKFHCLAGSDDINPSVCAHRDGTLTLSMDDDGRLITLLDIPTGDIWLADYIASKIDHAISPDTYDDPDELPDDDDWLPA